jgi:hypothetical protein
MFRVPTLAIVFFIFTANSHAYTAEQLQKILSRPSDLQELRDLRLIYESAEDRALLRADSDLKHAFDLLFARKMREHIYAEVGTVKFYAYMAKKFAVDPAFLSFVGRPAAAPGPDFLTLNEAFSVLDEKLASSIEIAVSEKFPSPEALSEMLREINFDLFPLAKAKAPLPAGTRKARVSSTPTARDWKGCQIPLDRHF